MGVTRALKVFLPITLFTFGLGVIWYIYNAALPGYFLFDDEFSLKGLEKVSDLPTTLTFIFSGVGVLGRPLAMLTFAMQADAWPAHPEQFLRANIAIHLCAVIAAFLVAVGLARLRPPEKSERALWIGAAVAALWGLSPFLATTHLLIIQRMTSLAGMLTLTGLAAFIWAHLAPRQVPTAPRALLLVTGLSVGAAALAKENGALLPLLCLTVLLFWIPRHRFLSATPERILQLLFLVLPSLSVVLYLTYLLIVHIDHGYPAYRYFSLLQRVQSQPAILFDYLRNLLLPNAFSVTPFMDRLPAPGGWLQPPITLLASLLWPMLLALAIYLRRSWPALLFGLVFFLVGHVMESTFIGLELYFAHRNYIPALGIYFALVWSVFHLPASIARIGILALVAYIMLFALVLVQVTTGWHDPYNTSQFWVERNPHSVRAAQFRANQQVATEDYAGASKTFEDAAAHNPEIAILQIQRTHFCVGQENHFPALLKDVRERLKSVDYHQTAVIELFKRAFGNPATSCAPRGYQAIAAMADALKENPEYWKEPFARAYLTGTQGLVDAKLGDLEHGITHLVTAFQIYPAQDFATYAAMLMANQGQYAQAKQMLDQARAKAPRHAFQRAAWLEHFDEVEAVIERSKALKSAIN